MPPPDSCTGPDDASCGSSTAGPPPTSCSTPTSASPSSPETTLAVHPLGHHTHDTRSPTAGQCSQAHQRPTPQPGRSRNRRPTPRRTANKTLPAVTGDLVNDQGEGDASQAREVPLGAGGHLVQASFWCTVLS